MITGTICSGKVKSVTGQKGYQGWKKQPFLKGSDGRIHEW